MKYRIIIQHATNRALVPKTFLLRQWAKKTLEMASKMIGESAKHHSAEVIIRIVDTKEMTALNSTFRHKNGPTNVLSFPFTMPKEMNTKMSILGGILGDIVICADVVNREAEDQHKTPDAHFAHMIVHGIFHLLGYDHEKDSEADVMEAMEITVMQSLGFNNPYETGENIKDYD